MLPHTPLGPPVCAPLQAWQSPAQAVLQQTPSTQLPLAQLAGAPQTLPWPSLGRQALPEQKKPAWQLASLVQVVRQAPVAASQTYAVQVTVPASTQVPLPSQVSAGDETLPAQEAAAQVVPAG
jgi:hypothetical protein